MPIRNAIWTVNGTPRQLSEGRLPSERALEDMIVSSPRILSDEWMLIGRQERTASGGFIDLLAVAPDGALVLIELKRDRTPREVVAQAIDYAVWVEELETQDIDAIYRRFAPGRDLAADFQTRFGQALDEETLNESHQIVIVAASLDDSSERIVGYPASDSRVWRRSRMAGSSSTISTRSPSARGSIVWPGIMRSRAPSNLQREGPVRAIRRRRPLS